MASSIFSSLEREQLDGYPQEIRAEDLSVYFRLSLADQFEIKDLRGPTNQFGFALQICALRYLGFSPKRILQAPVMARLYVAEQLDINLAQINEYGLREQTRTEHAARAQHYLGFRSFEDAYKQELLDWLTERALEHDEPRTLVEMVLQKLKAAKVVRPGLSLLERLVFTARDRVTERTYKLLVPQLTPKRREFLDSLLKRPKPFAGAKVDASSVSSPQSENETQPQSKNLPTSSEGESEEPAPQTKPTVYAQYFSRLEWLRQEPVQNSPAAILETIAKLEFLGQAGVEEWKLDELNPNRRRLLSQQAKRASLQALSSAPATRRYPVLAVFVCEMLIELTDLAVEMFDAYLSGVYSRAGRELEEFRLSIAEQANEKMHYLSQVGEVVLDEAVDDPAVRQAIYARLPKDKLSQAVEECGKLTRPLEDNYFDLLGQRYSQIREFAPKWLEALKWRSNLAAKPLLDAIELLRRMNREKLRSVPGAAPEAFISSRWEPYVYEKNGSLNRKYYELAILWELRQALRNGNIWVEGARRYAPLATHLIQTSEWDKLRVEAHTMLNLPADGAERIRQLESEISATLGRLAKLLSQGDDENSAEPTKTGSRGKKGQPNVRLEDGRLVVSRLEALELPASTKRLRQQVGQKLPRVELIDLVMETDRWTNFSQSLIHAGDGKACSEEQRVQLYAAIVAQGCNLGLANMSRMSGFSEGELRWLTNWHIREETLRSAVTQLVNFQHGQPLAKHWGSGGFSSSDGQRFVVSVPSRSRAALPRYFGYGRGLTIMSWTADQYIQFATRPARTTHREALYTLDGILNNQSDLPLKEHTTDTAGYTDRVFALFDLLDLKFAPRLRDLADQRLWRTSEIAVPKLFEEVFRGNVVRTSGIIENWDELSRLAASLKLGHSSASLVIGKLQGLPRHNAVSNALGQYGRLVKTEFILRYLESQEYRRLINAQLDKGENIHFLRDHLFWGNKGELRKRGTQDQLDQSWCLNLLVNCVLVWNTVYMQLALEALRKEGISIKESDLARLAPSRFRHINVFGRYYFEEGFQAVEALGKGYRMIRGSDELSVAEVVEAGRAGREQVKDVEGEEEDY